MSLVRMTKTKRVKLRAPFVTTFAAAAAVVACGGHVAGSSSGSTSSSGSGPTQDCPAVAPAAGDVCNVAADKFCSFGGTGCATTAYQCVQGRFVELQSSCNPPPSGCPTTEPLSGSACFGSGSVCSYPDACTGMERDTATCSGGTWSIASASYVAACPAVMPQEGTSCAACATHYPSSCGYNATCVGSPASFTARCDVTTGLWQISSWSCNPPPDAGPILNDGGTEGGATDASTNG